jgi:hypothetical protein
LGSRISARERGLTSVPVLRDAPRNETKYRYFKFKRL